MRHSTKQAFTLIELSIVLAVVALLLGGVLASIEGVKSAKTRTTLSQVTEIMIAIEQFAELYHYLPGDLLNADDYWGARCDSTPANCNGDGNWQVDFAAAATEDNRVFQHLQLAGLYEKGTSYTTSLVPGSSIPEAAFSGGGLWFATHNGMHGRNLGNALVLAAREDDNALDAGLITPRIALDIDEKVDDSLASTGFVQAAYGEDVGSGCVSGGWSAAGVSYVLTDETNSCRLAFFYNLRP